MRIQIFGPVLVGRLATHIDESESVILENLRKKRRRDKKLIYDNTQRINEHLKSDFERCGPQRIALAKDTQSSMSRMTDDDHQNC